MVQALYGTLMGLIIVWTYERYGGFLYPVLFHAAANVVVYILSSTDLINKIMTPVTVIITGAITTSLIILMIKENKT